MDQTTLTGYEAIEAARRTGRTLSKYADPTEEAREGLTVAEAEDVARQDPGLIYLPEAPESLTDLLDRIRAADPDGSIYAARAGEILSLVPLHLACSPEQQERAQSAEVQPVASDGTEELVIDGAYDGLGSPWGIREVR